MPKKPPILTFDKQKEKVWLVRAQLVLVCVSMDVFSRLKVIVCFLIRVATWSDVLEDIPQQQINGHRATEKHVLGWSERRSLLALLFLSFLPARDRYLPIPITSSEKTVLDILAIRLPTKTVEIRTSFSPSFSLTERISHELLPWTESYFCYLGLSEYLAVIWKIFSHFLSRWCYL